MEIRATRNLLRDKRDLIFDLDPEFTDQLTCIRHDAGVVVVVHTVNQTPDMVLDLREAGNPRTKTYVLRPR